MLAGIVAGLNSAFLAIISKLITKKLFESIITKLVISLLRKLAKMTSNKLDDVIVEDVIKNLNG